MNPITLRSPVRLRYLAVLALLGAMCVPLLPVQSAWAASASHIQVSRAALGATQHVEIGLNKSMIIDLPVDASEVIVSDPRTAGAVMRSKRRAIIQGMQIGETNIFFLDKTGARIAVFEVSITQDATGLASVISRLLPGSSVEVEHVTTAAGMRIILSGTVQSAHDAEKAVAVAAQYAGAMENVANLISVAGSQQVALKVTIAEIGRETVKQLGINLSGSLSIGGLTTTLLGENPVGGASNVIGSNSASTGFTSGGFNLTATLKALERRGAVRTLAEPTLTAISGEEAEFLAGGEFPVPSGIENGVLTFEFKKFGVNLKFTPTVMSNGVIGLTVETSVSEPTTEGGFSLNGITIPATKERKARTSVQLQSGSTLAIAGLMQDSVRQQINEIPGIGSVPILGALFRSRDFIRSQTELLIMVTPSLASAGLPDQLPTDKMVFASDAEAVFLGRMEKLYSVGGQSGGNYNGSVGFVLD